MRKEYMKLRKRRALKRRDKITVGLFVVGMLAMFGLGLALPLRPKVSDVEKRELEHFPGFHLDSFLDGDYFSQITLWYADTFPFRETLLSADSWVKGLYGIKTQQIYGTVAEADAIPVPGEALPKPAAKEPEEGADQPKTPVEGSPGVTEPEDDGSGDMPAGEGPLPDGTIRTEPEAIGSLYVADGKGFELFYFNQKGADAYASAINDAAQKLQGTAQVYTILVPTAVGVCLDEKIQEALKCSPQDEVFDHVYGQIGENVKKVPVFDTLKKHNAEYIYFNTDHHWTARGAYYAYREFAEVKGIEPKELEAYETMEFDGFLGSFYSFSGQAEVLKDNADTITAYVPASTNTMEFVRTDGVQTKWNIIYDVSDHNHGAKYSCFIGGDNPFSRIDDPAITDGPSCVVVKESYGNAFVPFLVDHYQTVYVIDYRYYKDNLVDLVKEEQVQDVIFLNNADALTEKAAQQIQAILD